MVSKQGASTTGTGLEQRLLELEGTSPAVELLRQGQLYRGPANILGVAYDVCCEPIKDATGAAIGAYLVALS